MYKKVWPFLGARLRSIHVVAKKFEQSLNGNFHISIRFLEGFQIQLLVCETHVIKLF